MSHTTSQKELKSSSIRELSQSHQSQLEHPKSMSIKETPSKSQKDHSSLRNYYQHSASYGAFLRSEMSENIFQEERKENYSQHPHFRVKRKHHIQSLVNKNKLNIPKVKH